MQIEVKLEIIKGKKSVVAYLNGEVKTTASGARAYKYRSFIYAIMPDGTVGSNWSNNVEKDARWVAENPLGYSNVQQIAFKSWADIEGSN